MDEDSEGNFEYDDDDDAVEDIQLDDDDDEDDQDDVDFGGAADDAFSTDILEKSKLKPFQVDFKCHSLDSLRQQQAAAVSEVASMFSLKDTDAAILLRHFNWNRERFIEQYLEEPEKLKIQAGVLDGPGRPRIQRIPDFTCEVCYMSSSDEDDGLMDTLALGCGHRFCKDCYQQYVEQKVKAEGESRRVQCMQEKCRLVLDEKTVELIASPEVYER